MNIHNTITIGLLLATTNACTPHSTGPTEVGVRVNKVGLIGQKGITDDSYAPGTTSFFPPIINDWYTFDVALQNLSMVRENRLGDRQGDDSLRFKTVDGNDISVNVTVAWQVDPNKAQTVLAFSGKSTDAAGQRLVRPISRTLIRDVLNELKSEEYYDANVRFLKGDEALALLNERLNPEGVIVSQVLLGEHKFNDRYEQIIKDKKVAEQDAARLISETEAAREQMRRELEVAKGAVSKAIEVAKGESTQLTINADAYHYSQERMAQATLAEASARAKGVAEQARALAGSVGDNMVKLKLAESLKGKNIIFVPTGGMDLRTTNMNDLLQTYGVIKATNTPQTTP